MPHPADSLPNFTGHTIDEGRYRLLSELGSGGYGKVYKAVLTTSPPSKPSFFAVKCLWRPEPGSRQEMSQMSELALHAHLADLDCVVGFHKVIHDDKFVYVVLDLCPGGDLFSSIVERKTFHLKDDLIRSTFVKVIDAVLACHGRGVFHRDLKPENILLSKDGSELFLSDFGLATAERESTQFGCGTSFYMSPENLNGKKGSTAYSTYANDVWALGGILTNLVTGRHAWTCPGKGDPSYAAYCKDPNYLQTVLPISSATNNIIKKIFQLDPSSRIRLSDLREEILNVDRFYMTRAEIALASKQVQKVAAELTTPVRRAGSSDSESSSVVPSPPLSRASTCSSISDILETPEVYPCAVPEVNDKHIPLRTLDEDFTPKPVQKPRFGARAPLNRNPEPPSPSVAVNGPMIGRLPRRAQRKVKA